MAWIPRLLDSWTLGLLESWNLGLGLLDSWNLGFLGPQRMRGETKKPRNQDSKILNSNYSYPLGSILQILCCPKIPINSIICILVCFYVSDGMTIMMIMMISVAISIPFSIDIGLLCHSSVLSFAVVTHDNRIITGLTQTDLCCCICCCFAILLLLLLFLLNCCC